VSEPEWRPSTVGYVFSKDPPNGWEKRARKLAEGDNRIRLVAKTAGHYTAFAILYSYNEDRQEIDELAEQLFGTQVAYEGKKGTRGLKTR
jgi:hypothetical protein